MDEQKRTKDVKKYELVIIMKPLLPDKLRREFNEKFSRLVSKVEGKIISKDVWGRKYLAYPIKKYKEGYYIIYQIELPSDKVAIVNKELGLSNELLRHLVLTKKD